ncbi:synaptotagmin-like protein 2 isoform X8 [Monodelphis domestica]|uniref:synaptotagmin-like protein 2 isoform X8 n=1 Tax=Monodelphis domestica TaxID=13616 RepID=UPI0024E25D0A|nr:synaptotagmin-like protein 2 isoform X8 [Monodelphis domestica]
MIDLSFLTEEEQEAIMKVLQRDAELKRAEEERVRHLPDKIKDDQQLKNMSGQWFYEAKSKRHRDKIHGADIIRESMRKKKPQIIVEPNQNRTARVKKTWVNNVDRDILLPSELLGEEPEDDVSGLSNSRTVILNPDPYTSDKAQENPRKSSMSSTKLRKNPFNGSMLPEDNLSFEIPNEPSENGQTGLHHTSKEDALFHLKENKSTPYVPKERLEEPRPAVLGSADGSPIKPPIPKARKLTYKNTSDQQPEDNQSHSKMVQRTDSLKSRSAPRGILKRNSSSSSTDSETVRFNHTLEPKSKNLPSKLIIHEGNSEDESIENESSQNPLEPLKHVRFSAVKEEVSQGPELNQGKEVGEFGLLEADISRNGMENSGDFQEFPNKPVFSKFRKPTQQNPAPDSYQSNGFSPSTANTYDQKTHPHSETLTQRLSSSENLSSNKESPKAPSKQLSLESELCANPADECPHWVEPELPQVQDLNNSADHQQGSEDESKAVLKALKRDADRKIPSQSLEDIPSDTSNQGKVDSLPEDLVRSAEDDQKTDQQTTNEYIPEISTVPSHPDNQFAHPEKLKRMSKSVPAFLQDESDDRETDTASESSYQLGRHKKSPSSLTNLSSSSGMTSLSSVSGSAMSVYSGDFGNLDIKGSVQFAIDYIDSLMEFHVFVAQCKDLAAADVKKQRSDPYVKTYLLPDKGKMGKKKTLVMKKTLNPVYNEILRYKIDKQSLKNQKLNLSVWHRDTFKRNSFLGEVELDLETWDWDNKQNKQLKWYPLNRRTAPVALEAENRGEMKLALQYVPDPVSGKKPATTGEVHIWVKECIDLPHLRGNHLNSFVKCTILPDTSRKSRQKTRAVGKTNNPIFNHTMVYDGFRPEDLKEACVELTVWDHHKLTNQFLGGLRIGFGTGKSYEIEVDWMDSTPAEISLWERMVNSPNTWIEDILPLRMLLIAKLTK